MQDNIKFITLSDLKELDRKMWTELSDIITWRVELQQKGENEKAKQIEETENHMSSRWSMICDLIEAIENNKDIKEL